MLSKRKDGKSHFHANSPRRQNFIFERIIPPPLRRFFSLFWLATFIALFCGAIFFSRQSTNPASYIEWCSLQLLGSLSIPFVCSICRTWLAEWGDEAKSFVLDTSRANIDAWFNKELNFFRGAPKMYIFAAALAAASPPIELFGDYPVGLHSPDRLFATLVITISGAFIGIALYAMICGARTVWRFGVQFDVIVRSHKYGILRTGQLLLQCCYLITITWCLFLSSSILGNMNRNAPFLAFSNPTWFFAIPTALAVVSCFVVCQILIYKRMVEYKGQQLLSIEQALDKIRDLDPSFLDKEARDRVTFLEIQRAQIVSLPEWPFAFASFAGTVLSGGMVLITPVVTSYIKTALAITQ